MYDIFSKISEARIKEAIEKGHFKNLPGQGKPLILEPINPFEAKEDRVANKIIKNLGLLPQEVDLKREIDNLKQKIAECPDNENINQMKNRLQEINIRYNVIMEKRRRR